MSEADAAGKGAEQMSDTSGCKRTRVLINALTMMSAAFICAAYGGLPAIATTLLRMSLQQMAASADLVVRGRCVNVESHWENGAIWTIAEIDVTESLKGASPLHIRVRSPGGRVGHIVSHVDSTPKIREGQDDVLFLQKNRLGDYSVTAWAEGMFHVRRAADGQETVRQASSDIAVFDPATRQFQTDGIRNLRLSDFRRQLVRALISPRQEHAR
jgi:hypothetical protein